MFERSPESYVPYAGHFPNSPTTAFCLDGTVFAMLRLQGKRFEFDGPDLRNGNLAVCNNLFRHINDENTAVYSHLVRHRCVTPSPISQAWTSAFGRDLYEAYAKHLLSDLRTNTWFLTILVRPPMLAAKKHLRFGAKAKPSLRVSPGQLRQLEETVRLVFATMHDYQPVRLGLRTEPTEFPDINLTFSEIAEALFLIRTALPLPVAYTNGSLGGAVYSQRAVFGPRSYDLNIPGYPRVGSIISFRNYPHSARPGCLNELLSAPYDLVLSQSLYFLLSQTSEARSALKEQQMENLGDRAKSLQKGLADAMDDLAAGRTASGMHHLSLAVYRDAESRRRAHIEDAIARLDNYVGDASKRLTSYGGANPMQEGRLGSENSYFAQLPNVAAWRTRPGELDTLSFAALSSFENFPCGRTHGHWGSAIARFRTRGGTAFDLVSHVEEVGHTAIFGQTGSGKTAVATFLLTCLEPSMGASGMRIIIDKDQGSRAVVELSGGRYLALRRGRDSGLAPLRGLRDSLETHSFLLQLFRGLILCDERGPIEPEEERRMARGIAAQMEMPAELRTMSGVREFMGYEKNGAGDRFEKWCRGGEMGWVLDNDEHLIDFHAPVDANLYGFDFTELMPKDEGMADDGACSAAAAVIVHQLREMMDGRRIAVFADECRFYMDVLGQVFEDLALTGRKAELMVWMAAQQIGHILRHPAGASLLAQCRTKILFPDKAAVLDDMIGIGFSRVAAEQVKTGMTLGGGRRFLLWRDDGDAAILDFDLSAMPEELAILSGRKSTIRLLDDIGGRIKDLAGRYSEFRRRHQEIRTVT
jgi:type IV secretion system protein VirB4